MHFFFPQRLLWSWHTLCHFLLCFSIFGRGRLSLEASNSNLCHEILKSYFFPCPILHYLILSREGQKFANLLISSWEEAKKSVFDLIVFIRICWLMWHVKEKKKLLRKLWECITKEFPSLVKREKNSNCLS